MVRKGQLIDGFVHLPALRPASLGPCVSSQAAKPGGPSSGAFLPTNEFLVAAYAMISNEITTDKKWPWSLPDPHKLAAKAHKNIQNRLLEVRFRDNETLRDSLLIDYVSDEKGDIAPSSALAARTSRDGSSSSSAAAPASVGDEEDQK